MKYSQFLALLCLGCCMCSCSSDELPTPTAHQDLIGHWNVTMPSGLQFVEFISETKVLIGDRGAIGEKDVSKHYLLDYAFTDDQAVVGLPSDSRLQNLSISGDKLSFDFINPVTGYSPSITAYKEDKYGINNSQINDLSRIWVTEEQDYQPIAKQDRKIAFFSKAGVYALTNRQTGLIDMFSWEWNEETNDELCYSEYQRPKMVPEESCMIFKILRPDVAIFEVDGIVIRLKPQLDI